MNGNIDIIARRRMAHQPIEYYQCKSENITRRPPQFPNFIAKIDLRTTVRATATHFQEYDVCSRVVGVSNFSESGRRRPTEQPRSSIQPMKC